MKAQARQQFLVLWTTPGLLDIAQVDQAVEVPAWLQVVQLIWQSVVIKAGEYSPFPATSLAKPSPNFRSIRMPASFCGIVGLKPTWGLVPYTGAIGLDGSIDHAGPMASNVIDCAALLQVIAGADLLDDRQQHAPAHGQIKYANQLCKYLGETNLDQLLKGVKIGILTEGFGLACSDQNVDALVLSAVDKFKSLGAEIKPYSVPAHSDGQMLWGVSTFAGSYRQSALGYSMGRKQVHMTDRIQRCRVGQEEFDHAGAGARNMMLSGAFLEKYYGPALYARSKNLQRRLNVSHPMI